MKSKLFLLFVILASAAGAVLRAFSLVYGYEPDTGLPVSGYAPAIALIVLTVIVMVGTAGLGRVWFGVCKELSFEQLFGGVSAVKRVICMLCGILTAITGVMGLLRLNDQVYEQSNEHVELGVGMIGALALIWVLAIIAGISMVLLPMRQHADQPATRLTGLFATLPMFWCCMDLIMIYHENSGNPVISDYSYQLFLTIAVMAAFYSMSGFLFSTGSATRFFAAAGTAVYLMATQVLGTVIGYGLIFGVSLNLVCSTSNLLRLAAYGAAGLFLLMQLANALQHTKAN